MKFQHHILNTYLFVPRYFFTDLLTIIFKIFEEKENYFILLGSVYDLYSAYIDELTYKVLLLNYFNHEYQI